MFLKRAFALVFCAALATVCHIPARQLAAEPSKSAIGFVKTVPITLITSWLWVRVYRYFTGDAVVHPLLNVGIALAAPKAADYLFENILVPRQATYDHRVIHAHLCHSQFGLRSPQKLAQTWACRQRYGLGEIDARKQYRIVTRQRAHGIALSYDRVSAEECVIRKEMSLKGTCPCDQYDWEKQRLADIIIPCYNHAGFHFTWEEFRRQNDSATVIRYKFPFPLTFQRDQNQTKILAVSGVQKFEVALETCDYVFAHL